MLRYKYLKAQTKSYPWMYIQLLCAFGDSGYMLLPRFCCLASCLAKLCAPWKFSKQNITSFSKRQSTFFPNLSSEFVRHCWITTVCNPRSLFNPLKTACQTVSESSQKVWSDHNLHYISFCFFFPRHMYWIIYIQFNAAPTLQVFIWKQSTLRLK